jgi:hypothetical protein
MPAPKGNQFWKLRSKHGRDKLFSDPKLLLETAFDYFQWCDDHPWYKNEQVKTAAKPFHNDDGEVVFPPNICEIPTARPYSLSGLCHYLNCDEVTLRSYTKDEDKKDFFTVTHAIVNIIETQQFEGATVGAFNANIIARKLGLVDKKDVTTDGKQIKHVFKIAGQTIEF